MSEREKAILHSRKMKTGKAPSFYDFTSDTNDSFQEKTPKKVQKLTKKIRSPSKISKVHKTPRESQVLKINKKSLTKKPFYHLDFPKIDDIKEERPKYNVDNLSDSDIEVDISKAKDCKENALRKNKRKTRQVIKEGLTDRSNVAKVTGTSNKIFQEELPFDDRKKEYREDVAINNFTQTKESSERKRSKSRDECKVENNVESNSFPLDIKTSNCSQNRRLTFEIDTPPQVNNAMENDGKTLPACIRQRKRTFELETTITDKLKLPIVETSNSSTIEQEMKLMKSINKNKKVKLTKQSAIDILEDTSFYNVKENSNFLNITSLRKSSEKNKSKNNSTFEIDINNDKSGATKINMHKNNTSAKKNTILKNKSKSNDSTYEIVKNNSTFEVQEPTILNSPMVSKKQVNFKTPPSGTSTPFLRNQFELMLKKTPKISIKKKTPRTKIPNFSLIHKKAFERMESLEENLKRKEERAKVLLSGCKPSIHLSFGKDSSKSNISSTKNEQQVSKSKKQLQFSSSLTRPGLENSKLKSSIVVPFQPEIQFQASKLLPPKKTGYTRFGFKMVDAQKVSKQEAIRAVANKTRVKKDDVQQRRDLIKGVRSNRRFDLLMKMRDK